MKKLDLQEWRDGFVKAGEELNDQFPSPESPNDRFAYLVASNELILLALGVLVANLEDHFNSEEEEPDHE